MRGYSPIVAALLLPFVPAMFTAQGFATSAMPAEQPAGCHEPMPAPAPAPVSYQCCVMGHHWAVPGTTFSVDAPVAHTLPTESQDGLFLSQACHRQDNAFLLSSASPPQFLPLRI